MSEMIHSALQKADREPDEAAMTCAAMEAEQRLKSAADAEQRLKTIMASTGLSFRDIVRCVLVRLAKTDGRR